MTESTQNRCFFVRGQRFDTPPLAPGLYLVSTPIGNLGDMTLRALDTLAAADLILCEDTRTSARLLDHFGIKTRRIAFHEHNERQKAESVIADIEGGKSVALISDAGTPLLSDPGFPLVRAARERNIEVFAIPGASALLSGLAISGLPTDAFSFVGFLPQKSGARREAISSVKDRPDTLIFYEAPRRLARVLADMAEIFGDRQAIVCLELTKRFERTRAGSLSELANHFDREEEKGEAVLLVAGADRQSLLPDEADWQASLVERMAELPLRQAVDEVAAEYALKRKQVYDAALALKK